ncbi:10524_t:CDS:2, partial [Racocetra persica]
PADEEEKKSWKETREKTLEYFYDDYLSEKERNELNEEEKLKLVLEKKLAQEEENYLQIEEKEITITKFDEKTGAERNVQKKKKTTALEKLNKQANYSYVKFATKKLGMAHLTTERITNYRAFHKEIKRVIEANELVFEAKHYKINVFMLQNALAQAFTSGGLSSQKWVEHEFFNKLGDALKKVAEKDSGAWPDNQFTSCLKKYFEIIAEETAEMRQEELLKEEKDAWLEKTNKNIELKAKAREQCLKKIANLEKDILFLSTPEPQPAPEAMPTSWTTLF